MHPSDRDMPARGDIIPFPVDTSKSKGLLTTTIGAFVAVTIVHDENVNAEDKLLELIELFQLDKLLTIKLHILWEAEIVVATIFLPNSSQARSS